MTVGIDPGKKGGIAWFHEGQISVLTMPEDPAEFGRVVKELKELGCTQAWVERVGPRPEDGVRQAFSFGGQVMMIRTALGIFDIERKLVLPRTWQKEFGMGKKFVAPTPAKAKTLRKRAHRAKAGELFPNLKLTIELADAVLIAEYGRRKESVCAG